MVSHRKSSAEQWLQDVPDARNLALSCAKWCVSLLPKCAAMFSAEPKNCRQKRHLQPPFYSRRCSKAFDDMQKPPMSQTHVSNLSALLTFLVKMIVAKKATLVLRRLLRSQ